MVRLTAAIGCATAALALASGGTASAREQRCGWIENPTPANWSLVDRQREWILGVQGGYQAPGLDDLPDLSVKGWVVTNGSSYGYGCACLTVDLDAAAGRITRIYAVQQKALGVCRADRALPKP